MKNIYYYTWLIWGQKILKGAFPNILQNNLKWLYYDKDSLPILSFTPFYHEGII